MNYKNKLIFDVLTIFPDMFTGPLTESIIKRAQEKKIVQINLHNLRNYTTDKHCLTDDYAYGGGAGMIMKPEPIFCGVEKILAERTKGEKKIKPSDIRVVLMSPRGKQFTQGLAKKLKTAKCLILICGHYKGVDERVKALITDEISIGNYVLTGGELPAMVLIDAVTRLIPKVVRKQESVKKDSFSGRLLDYPHYTRPESFRGLKVPEVLLSGNHSRIEKWRKIEALKNTFAQKPELLGKIRKSKEEKKILAGFKLTSEKKNKR
ncbi:tRNA (guanosine(37)-N1)-methyltransferase TrmD [bacterium]|nr:tRNA (guanosine(37)-N1)-methyltransferase TrmD [bacterium]